MNVDIKRKKRWFNRIAIFIVVIIYICLIFILDLPKDYSILSLVLTSIVSIIANEFQNKKP